VHEIDHELLPAPVADDETAKDDAGLMSPAYRATSASM